MKKFIAFTSILIFAFFFHISITKAGIHFTESFTTTPFSTTYIDGQGTLNSGVWDYFQIRRELATFSYGATGGAARFNNNAATTEAYLITPSVNTVGTLTFWYRELNTGGGTITIQKSVGGGAYTTIGTQIFSGTSYNQYSLVINDASNDIRIKILSSNNPGYLIIDDVSVTDLSSDPLLAANPTGLSGFTYIVGSGPSSSQSFNLSGSYLTGAPGNISVTAPTNYEVSLDNTLFSTSINVVYAGATLSSTPVYVRLKSGLSVNTYNSALISISGGGATTINVTCNGSVTDVPPPTLSVNTSTLSGFTYVTGNGPSSSQSYNLSGINLTGSPGNIVITAPTDYEVSTDNSTFSASLNIPYSSATLSSTSIYVRLKASLAIAAYDAEVITNAGGGATTVSVTCSGSVTDVPPPVLSLSVSTLSGFTYVTGNGPSFSQSYNLSGTNLTGSPGNIVVTAPSDYEVSTDNSTFSTSLNIPYSSATLSSTPIYVRLKAALAIATYDAEVITNAGGGATTVNVTCSGSVTDISTTCGSETFANIPTATSTSYLTRSWTGDDGNVWNATSARTDQTITDKAICFKGYVESPVSLNGIGDLTVTTKFPFSDGTFDLPVYVNGVQVGTVPVSSTVTTTTITGINIVGSVQIKFESNGTKRPCIDDLSWTCYDIATNVNEVVDYNFELDLFPNPATDIVNGSINSSSASQARIEIYNILGETVSTSRIQLTEGNSLFTIDVSHLSAGVYYVTLRNNSGSFYEKKQLIVK